MPFYRVPRFKRASTVANIELTNRDRTIIQIVRRYRFLRSSQIVGLIGGPTQPLLRRLQLLYHHGYLERPRAQLDYYHKGGSRQIVYGLGNKGANLLRTENGGAFDKIRSSEKNRSVGRVFLEHTLLVSDVMATIEIACRQGHQVRLLTQNELSPETDAVRKSQSFRWRVSIGSGVKLGVVPDRVFGLEFAGKNGRSDRAFFFLEADRGTMPVTRSNLSQTSFYRKLLAYEATWSQSIHKARFGFHRFRVLTVTKSTQRVESLVRACAELKRGHGLFLFADKTILETPANIFSLIWRSGKAGKLGSLLD